MPESPIPLTILTGFLGAGKTTVLNRMLGAAHRQRIAVLVNELGRIDVDAALIRSRAGDVLELAGGCVCHQLSVQNELLAAIDEVALRSRPQAMVLETTGIAEPAAILKALERAARRRARRSEDAAPAVRAAAVVTVVDAEAGARQLERHEEARDQVVTADRILVSKTDLCAPDRLADLHGRLQTLAPGVPRASFPPGDAGTAALGPWLLEPAEVVGRGVLGASAAARAGGHGADTSGRRHPHQLCAVTFVDRAPLLGETLLLLCAALGERLVRAKGAVHLAGEPRRGVLERAGERTTLTLGAPWSDGETPETRIVLIGDSLDEAMLVPQLWACRAAV
jgi:G3E family GTPase